jgi:hypothetical protein
MSTRKPRVEEPVEGTTLAEVFRREDAAEANVDATLPPAPEPVALPQLGIERYTVVTIPRSAVTNAGYNPRKMSDSNYRRLKTGIGKLGLLGPIIWNVRTGHVVGGHQRLKVSDGLMRGKAYQLQVSQVDLSLKEEKEANLLLNNTSAQGEWEFDKLEDLLSDEADPIDLTAAGFDASDVYRMFGADPLDAEAMRELSEKLQAVRDTFDHKIIADKKFVEDFYLVVVFKDHTDRLVFLNALALDDNRYQDGRVLAALIREKRDELGLPEVGVQPDDALPSV